MSDNGIVEPRGDWRGAFTWDGYFMRMRMSTVTRKYCQCTYDIYNPRTWPLIAWVGAGDSGADYRKSKIPPRYVAYPQTRIDSMDELQPIKLLKFWTPKMLFEYYPFNYNRKGQLRAHPHIPSDELEEWMSLVNRDKQPNIEESYKEDIELGPVSVSELERQLDRASKEAEEAKETAHSYRLSALKYQTEAEIQTKLKVLFEKYLSEDRAEAAGLWNDLRSLKSSKSELQSMFDNLEREHEQSLEAREKLWQNQRESELSRKTEEIKGLESEVKKLQAHLAVANQETAAEKETIVKIWEGMKKLQEASSQKHKATEEVSEAPRKKAKTEA
jgi:hypothetical protein